MRLRHILQRVPSRPSAAMSAAVAGVCLVVAGGIIADYQVVPSASHAQCADDPSRLTLTTADLPGFDKFLDFRFDTAPVKGAAPVAGVSPPDFVSDYQAGWMRGFLIDSAMSGPFRADLDARARELNYPIQKLPYIPLIGEIVAQSKGPLEVYEEVDMYTTRTAAEDWLANLRSGLAQSSARRVAVPGVSPGAMMLTAAPFVDDGFHESQVWVAQLIGTTVVRVTIQLPPHNIDLPEVGRIASTAINRVIDACPANGSA